MRATAKWSGGLASDLADDRGHHVTVDLPPEEGGRDAGTSALELSVLSLAGCISTIFALVARRRRLPYEALEVDLEASRPRGSRTIVGVEGTCRVVTEAPADEVAATLGITLRTCPVGVLFEQAHIPVDVRPVTLTPAVAAAR